MKTFLLRFFTWWNGQTFGTQLWTWLYGEFVGEDEFGNRYFRTRGGKIDPTLGFERRWVVYNGIAEASMVPPSWHGWLHHTVDIPPTEGNGIPRPRWTHHRPTGRAPSHRFDSRPGPQTESHRRLQSLDAGQLRHMAQIALSPPYSG